MFELVAFDNRAEDAGGVGTGGGTGLRVLETGVVGGGFVGVALGLVVIRLLIIVVVIVKVAVNLIAAIPLNPIPIVTAINIPSLLLHPLLPVPQQPSHLVLFWHLP